MTKSAKDAITLQYFAEAFKLALDKLTSLTNILQMYVQERPLVAKLLFFVVLPSNKMRRETALSVLFPPLHYKRQSEVLQLSTPLIPIDHFSFSSYVS